MIIKTPEFIFKFFTDFRDIIFFSSNYELIRSNFFNKVADIYNKSDKSYEEILNDELNNQENFKNPNKPPLFRFVGSFATKDFGKILSDIDTNQNVNFNNKPMQLRLKQIIENTDPQKRKKKRENGEYVSPFIFIRFYLGSKKGFETPWSIDADGNCEFDINGIDNWLIKIKKLNLPPELYEEISSKLKKDTLSLQDLVKIEDSIRRYTSIDWLSDDILQGSKTVDGEEYNLWEMLNTPNSKIVLKFIYEYNNGRNVWNGYSWENIKYDNVNLDKDYMLIDLSLNMSPGDIVSLQSYYSDNISYKFKSLKRYLPTEIIKTYREDFGNNAGYLTTVGTRLDLLEKLERYNKDETLMPKNDFDKLREDLNEFASYNGYNKINPDFREQSIKEMDKDVQEIITDIRTVLFTKYEKQIVNKKKEFYYYSLRGEEASLQINKNILHERINNGIKCPFFFLQGKDLKSIIDIALRFEFDPVKFCYCINNLSNISGFDSQDIFNDIHTEFYSLEENSQDLYNLFSSKLLLSTNKVEDLNKILKKYNLSLEYKNREYTLFEETKNIIKEKRIEQINNFIKDKNLYIKYQHYSPNKYHLYNLNYFVVNDITLKEAQTILITRIIK